ncbi:MAG TPA: sulfotransferase [Rhizomicrobium sp.]|nr:sulfotransferase [Rhizomicrobium sp.]
MTDPLDEEKQKLFPPLRNRILAQAAGALGENRAHLAEPLVSKFLKKHPNDPSALNLMADIARRAERFAEAEQLLSRCVEQSACAGYRFNYAVVLRRLDKFDEALAQLDELLIKEPRNPLYREQKAEVLNLMRRQDEAFVIHRELSEEFPNSPDVWLNYGDTWRSTGHFDQCIAAYHKALELAPTLSAGYPRLVELKFYRFTMADIEWMEKQLDVPGLSADDRANLYFALGNAYGDQEFYAKSFEFYAKANALRRLGVGFDPERLSAYRLNCQSVFTEAFFRDRIGWGCASSAPIFIVGIPRSGSTLLEQILCGHTAIEGLGELADLGNTIASGVPSGGKEGQASVDYVKRLRSLAADDFRSICGRYLDLTARRRRLGRPYFTDKALTNFWHAGLIHLILPNAKIIDVRRHPLDCGWSCFKTRFPTGQPFADKLSDIGQHYADYVRLMAHFDHVLPGRIHRVIYEDLVANPETEIRRLFDYLGLPFEEQCLRFHENPRTVRTLSVEQVRMPLYRSGMGQWRPYEPWLGPLRAALGPVLDAYPDVPK